MDESAADSLSTREREVLRLVAAGFQSKEIAAQLGLSRYRVDDLCSSACLRLGVNRRIDAARILARVENLPPERFGANPIGVFKSVDQSHADSVAREERAVFGEQYAPPQLSTTVDGHQSQLSALQVLAWVAITIAALAIVGIALPPLAASVQTIANDIQPPTPK